VENLAVLPADFNSKPWIAVHVEAEIFWCVGTIWRLQFHKRSASRKL